MAKGDLIRVEYMTPTGNSALEVQAEKNGATLEVSTAKEGKEDWVVVTHYSKAGKELSVSKVKSSAVIAVVDLPAKPRTD